MFASPLHSRTKNELLLLVCFSRPPKEDGALFGLVASEATRVNEVKELEQEAVSQEEGDQPRVRKSGGTMRMQCELFLDCCHSCLHLV
jgi:hypothetical protein